MTGRFGKLVVGGVLLGLVGATAPAKATMGDRAMYITFSRSVALPGVELAAGTYLFTLASPDTNQSLVRVQSKDRQHVYLTAFTVDVRRPAGAKSPITLGEAAHGQAPRIQAWFPDDQDRGRQFLYRD